MNVNLEHVLVDTRPTHEMEICRLSHAISILGDSTIAWLINALVRVSLRRLV